ncbi:uncharacterized protein LOC122664233 [Telopea speciosissima]|uniref:uncharacterized protein LOC122664233 n=1 Tax=Telopea speciosissima TaxID=54955 RepID=UPI001CC6E585|nr:uncharacterized protein LOC122664233 [Telopea speciosissima]
MEDEALKYLEPCLRKGSDGDRCFWSWSFNSAWILLRMVGTSLPLIIRKADRFVSNEMNQLISILSSSLDSNINPRPRGVVVELDVSVEVPEIDPSVQRAWDVFSQIDALVNNTGVRDMVRLSLSQTFMPLPEDIFSVVLNVLVVLALYNQECTLVTYICILHLRMGMIHAKHSLNVYADALEVAYGH